MRALVLLSLAAVLLCAAPAVSFAERVQIKDTTCDYDCLKNKCADVGGTFSGNHSNYGCQNNDKGTEVQCSGTSTWHQCYGVVPIKAGGGKGSITNVLKGGVTVQPISGDKGNVGNGRPMRDPVNIGVKNPPTRIKTDPIVEWRHDGMNQNGEHRR